MIAHIKTVMIEGNQRKATIYYDNVNNEYIVTRYITFEQISYTKPVSRHKKIKTAENKAVAWLNQQ